MEQRKSQKYEKAMKQCQEIVEVERLNAKG